MSGYSDKFYLNQQQGSLLSAKEIVPLIVELVQPQSVADVGCGVGMWLSIFNKNGVEDLQGVDGDWVNRDMLKIPHEKFQSVNLNEPLRINRTFDLAMSLEVAEHLPKERAKTFVNSLTALAPVVVFSSAIPFQGGKNHLNEQWPDYWAGLFAEENFVAVDCIRKRIWQNKNVMWWYRQNMLMYVDHKHLESNIALKSEFEKTDQSRLSMVHPESYMRVLHPKSMSMKRLSYSVKTMASHLYAKAKNIFK